MADQEFTVTEDHLKLIRAMYFGWQDCEFGAPEVDPKRPYGNSDVIGDIAEILGAEPDFTDQWGDTHWSSESADRFNRLHRETQKVLQIAVRTGRFETGVYGASSYREDWERIRD